MYVVDGLNNENRNKELNSTIAPWLELARNAKMGGNNEEAISYFNKVLETDIANSEAWYGKAQSICFSSTPYKLRLNESIICYRNAIKNAKDSDEMKKLVAIDLSKFANILHRNTMDRMLQRVEGVKPTSDECHELSCSCLDALSVATEFDNNETYIEIALKILKSPMVMFNERVDYQRYFTNKMKELGIEETPKHIELNYRIEKEKVLEKTNDVDEYLSKAAKRFKILIVCLYKIGKMIFFSILVWICAYLLVYIIFRLFYSGKEFESTVGMLGVVLLFFTFIYMVVRIVKILKSSSQEYYQ